MASGDQRRVADYLCPLSGPIGEAQDAIRTLRNQESEGVKGESGMSTKRILPSRRRCFSHAIVTARSSPETPWLR